ncbi:MAG: DNA alkylation response protein, partial [Phaeobacter italicus]
RVLCDAHLGSIWEGTSNIVALDVARAVRRTGALDALRTYVAKLLEEAADTDIPVAEVRAVFTRAADLLDTVANERAGESDVRLAASAVYNATSAVLMIWEDAMLRGRSGYSSDRQTLAKAVVTHKLSARDPLARTDEGDLGEDQIAAILDRALAEDVTTADRVAAQ